MGVSATPCSCCTWEVVLVKRVVASAEGGTFICADVTQCERALPVPIGWPIDNVCVRLVDRDGAPLPLGAVGAAHRRRLRGGGYAGNPADGAPECTFSRPAWNMPCDLSRRLNGSEIESA